ncbi:erythromycin esterase family protein [Pedobacter sp. SYSU D00535]|uniref:erythromycin esterase family protein n=1 Tax=Pedobacter sp. SYSU D00535 TaxID=2810308 RepID=UPI001A959BBA|nr:erythromycin esterase family protein [Pedobacter sp. SYSU D00535]
MNYTGSWGSRGDEEKETSYQLKSAKDLDPLMDRIGDAHHVLLGEASHGTHEYYTWRTEITKRLIKEKAFNFIAVEGDWPDCYRINRYIKGYADQDKKAVEVLKSFDRWPTWMWANWEIVALIDWLKEFNTHLPANKRIGFYGLDVYSLWESMEALMDYLSKNDPKAAEFAREAILCFEPYGEDEHRYARSQYRMEDSCRDEVIRLLQEIRKKAQVYDHDPEATLNTEQNAIIAVNAEEYYRNMVSADDNTWNLRDTHMMETLNRLLEFHGKEAKAIVWEHNTHIGDARYTDMKKAGMINVGQLVREQKGEADTVLVGFGSYSGRVIAGDSWGAKMESMLVPDARPGSIEEILHQESPENKLLIFDRLNKKERFGRVMPHRAIGVVYNPAYEKYGNYVPTVLNARYDAFLYIDKTKALHPLHMHADPHKLPETYPFQT